MAAAVAVASESSVVAVLARLVSLVVVACSAIALTTLTRLAFTSGVLGEGWLSLREDGEVGSAVCGGWGASSPSVEVARSEAARGFAPRSCVRWW